MLQRFTDKEEIQKPREGRGRACDLRFWLDGDGGGEEEPLMKRHIIAFFIIALCSELVTTWVQRLRTVSDVEPGLYYPSFKALMFDRLIVWTIIFPFLTAIWAFVVKRAEN
jgi:hypothetical protein